MAYVRQAKLDDAERLTEIYDYYVQKTAISFEYDTPSVEEFRGRMAEFMKKYPYIVLVDDGELVGYAYAHAFVGRKAYEHSVEITIYLDQKVTKKGYGKMLFEALENRLKNMGILNLYSCIAVPETEDEYLNRNSADFHAHMGFREVGVFKKCGRKFDRWYDMAWMEKIIGEHK